MIAPYPLFTIKFGGVESQQNVTEIMRVIIIRAVTTIIKTNSGNRALSGRGY